MAHGRRKPWGWTAAVTEETVTDRRKLADSLQLAADGSKDHVPPALAALAAQRSAEAARSPELCERLTALSQDQQRLMPRQLALLAAALMRGYGRRQDWDKEQEV